jgi:hypothetical protein
VSLGDLSPLRIPVIKWKSGPVNVRKAQNMTARPAYLRRAQAAEYVRQRWGLPCSHGYLHKLASVGGGPIFHRAGKCPLYLEDDLDAWARSRISGPLRKASDTPETHVA